MIKRPRNFVRLDVDPNGNTACAETPAIGREDLPADRAIGYVVLSSLLFRPVRVLSVSKPEPIQTAPPSFEDALLSLEEIVGELEEGQIGLADALARYEQGVKLLKQCYELLQHAERRIELLSCIGSAGEAITEPFDEAPQALEEKAEARSQRRSRVKAVKTDSAAPLAESPMDDMDDPGRLF